MLEAISQQIDHATRNTNQLLALARSDTAAIVAIDFDLGELVREVALALLPQARAKDIDFGIEVAGQAPLPARGDRWLLREAITNLADNAIRYTPQGGEVTVQVSADALGFGVTVLDNGPSVSADELPRLGQRFVRGRAGQGGGSGLGLAIARSIVTKHGGSLQLGQPQGEIGMRKLIVASLNAMCVVSAHASPPAALAQPECIAPAKPGGGFDLTCKLAQAVLQEAKLTSDPLRVTYMPGGIGALAYNAIIRERAAEPNVIVAFSGGSLLNLAQGKFGKHTGDEVRWLAVLGADYGALIVRKDSPLNNIKDLVAALHADANKVVFGGGGTVGSQDWTKVALTARAAGIGHKNVRFVAFEGGGEALSALIGGHVHVMSGDTGEVLNSIESGAPIRVLAILSEKRLQGRLASVPTAREQGYDMYWPVFRGFYMGPKVDDAAYQAWVEVFDKAIATPQFKRLRDQKGLYSSAMTGAQADAFVKRSIADYRQLADQLGLRFTKP